MGAATKDSMVVRVVNRAFAGIVSLWPADSREWARAMQAEMSEVTGTRERLAWLCGGTMSLATAWTQKLVFGKGKTGAAAKPVKKPGVLAFALMAMALLSLALPGMWAGIASITNVWTSTYIGPSQGEIAKLAREGERKHDARLLAFAAMWAKPTDALHYADEAVALDPSLTWIYFETRYDLRSDPAPAAEIATRMARLEKAEPMNATGYLGEAQGYFAAQEPRLMPAHREASAAEMGKNAAWVAAMEKAIRAPIDDSFALRRIQLVAEVMRERRIERPVELLYAKASTPFPNLYNVSVYNTYVVQKAEAAAARGDVAGAREQYDELLQYSQRVRTSDSVSRIETLMALTLSRNVFASEEKTLGAAGLKDEAAAAALSRHEIENEQAEFRNINRREWEAATFAIPGSLMIHLGTAIGIASGAISVFAFGGTALASVRRREYGRGVARSARIAPAVAIFSLGLFYVNYLPYRHAFWTASGKDIAGFDWQLVALASSPISQLARHPASINVFFWTAAIIAGAALSTVLVARMILRGRFDGAAA